MKRPRLSSSLPGRLRLLKPKRTPPGAAPGAITIAADALAPRLFITSYSTEMLRETPVESLAEILSIITRFPDCTHWIELKGFADKALMESFCHEFGIHRLEMEDVINTYQRPKLEETDDHLFVVSRFLKVNADGLCTNEQLSLFLFKNMIITFQEHYEDFFDPVRSRLRTGKGHLRSSGVDYMAYALLDAVVDTYFPLLEQQGDLLDQLEDELFTNPSRSSLQKIQAAKRTLIVFRRTVFAERDKVNDILRTSSMFINDATKVFFRDTYDHTIQVMDLVESYKEITASLMEIYLSSVSNRLNQIMKVLAIISTIFIPLTFIVGVYGMNFAVEDPQTGEQLPWNMPELYMPMGYVGVMLFMLAIVIVQLIIFWRKGWLSDR
jgi:magnesium transporter